MGPTWRRAPRPRQRLTPLGPPGLAEGPGCWRTKLPGTPCPLDSARTPGPWASACPSLNLRPPSPVAGAAASWAGDPDTVPPPGERGAGGPPGVPTGGHCGESDPTPAAPRGPHLTLCRQSPSPVASPRRCRPVLATPARPLPGRPARPPPPSVSKALALPEAGALPSTPTRVLAPSISFLEPSNCSTHFALGLTLAECLPRTPRLLSQSKPSASLGGAPGAVHTQTCAQGTPAFPGPRRGAAPRPPHLRP